MVDLFHCYSIAGHGIATDFAHATAKAAQLSRHVQNLVAIGVLKFGWDQHEIYITLEL